MFENTIKEKSTEMLEKLDVNEDISLASLLEISGINGFHKNFITFTYDDPAKIFSVDELKNIIENSESLYLNFLIRPRASIKFFIYRNDEFCKLDRIQTILNLFSIYDFLTKKIPEKIKEKYGSDEKISLSFNDFDKVIRAVETDFFENLDSHGFTDMLKPMEEYFGKNNIPPSALSIFFDDRAMYSLAEKFDAMEDPSILLSINDILPIIQSKESTEEETAGSFIEETKPVMEVENVIPQAEEIESETPSIEKDEITDESIDSDEALLEEEIPEEIQEIEDLMEEENIKDSGTIQEAVPDADEIESEIKELDDMEEETQPDELDSEIQLVEDDEEDLYEDEEILTDMNESFFEKEETHSTQPDTSEMRFTSFDKKINADLLKLEFVIFQGDLTESE